MESLFVLAPMVGAGIGLAIGYEVTHKNGGLNEINRRIHFVEEENLESELEDLEISIAATDTCMVCGDEIEPEDVGALVHHDGEYKLVCKKLVCLDTYDI